MDVDKLIEKLSQVFPFKTSRQDEAKGERMVKSYDEQLHEGNAALQVGDLKAAEQHFASALKQVHDPESPQLREEEQCLRKLGTVYARRGVQTKDGLDFAKATALYNAALARGGNKHILVDAIKKSERLFLYHTVRVDHEPSPYDTDIEHKNRLEKYRAEVKARLQKIHNDHNPYTYDDDDPHVKDVEMKRANSVKDLFKDISKQRKDFIKDLVQECIKTIGPPPCQYAMVGLGSQATELVTPYSDLEFAILIEENKDTSDNKEYFLNLTCYLYLKIINLGETILPAVAIRSLNDFCSQQTAEKTTEYPTEDRYPTEGPKEDRTEDSTASPAEGGAEDSAKKLTKGLSKVPTEDPVEVPTEENSNEDPAKDSSDNTTEDRTENLKEGEADDHAGSWFYDSVTPRGFAFDGAMPWASKTPFGREKTRTKPAISLIQTPAGMAEFQRHDIALAHGYHLSSILRHVSFLTGNQALVDEYMARVIQGLDAFDDSWSRTTVADTFARASLSQIIEENLDQKLTDRTLDVKKEIYRFPTVAVVNLGLLNGVYATSVWDVIQEMEKAGVVTKENAHHLQVLVSISGELRLRTYLELGAQKENLSGLLAMRRHPQDCVETFFKSVFHVPDQKMLFRYYYTADPLKEYIEKMIDTVDLSNSILPAEIVAQTTFYCASTFVKGELCCATLQFNAAIAYLDEELRDAIDYQDADVDTEDRYDETSIGQRLKRINLRLMAYLQGQRGATYSRRGDQRKAISCLEEQLRLLRQLYGHNSGYTMFTLVRLLDACNKLGDNRMAMIYCQQMLASVEDRSIPVFTEVMATFLDLFEKDALDDPDEVMVTMVSFAMKLVSMLKATYGETSVYSSIQAQAEMFFHLGDYTKAITYDEESIKIMRTMYGQDTAHPDIAKSLTHLGYSLCKSSNDHAKAARYYEEALDMNKVVYGSDTPHPATADILHKLGVEWDHLGDHKKSQVFYEQALRIYQEFYGKAITTSASRDTITAICIMGHLFEKSEDNLKAIGCYEEAHRMIEELCDKHILFWGRPDIATSLGRLGAVCHKAGEYEKSLQYFERELEIKKAFRGQDVAHPSIAESLCNLAAVYYKLDNYTKAIQFYENALNMTKIIHCGNETSGREEARHPDIAGILNNLGCLWNDVGDNEKARAFWEQALKMYQDIHGPTTSHHDTATVLGNIGVVWRKSGDILKAISFYEEALKMKEDLLGNNKKHPGIVSLLSKLGSACQVAGEYTKSLQYYERVLEINKSIQGHGAAHPSIAQTLCNLAAVYKDLGDHTKAAQFYEGALNMTKTIHGANEADGACHSDIANILNDLGCLWDNVGDNEKARTFWEQALKMYQELYGPTTPYDDTAMVLRNMGLACLKAGENQKSLQYYEDALNMLKTIHGANETGEEEEARHPDIARILNDLGCLWNDVGNNEKARTFWEQALKMYQELYGPTTPHHDTALVLTNMGVACHKAGENQTSLQYYEDALSMLKTIHGANETGEEEEARHPDIANILTRLGCLWYDVGDNEKASAFWEQALKMYQELYGPTTPHHDTALVLRNMGIACHKAGENQKSLQYSEEALNMLKTIHGANQTHGREEVRHPDIARILNDLGCLWNDVGNNEKARTFWEQALKMYQELYGPTTPHHDTALVLTNMGVACHKAGENQTSLQYYEDALSMLKTIHGANETGGSDEARHPDIAGILNGMGCLWYDVGDNAKARPLFEQALEMYQKLHGTTTPHHDTAMVLANMGEVLEKAGDHFKAISFYKEALKMRKEVLGSTKENPDIASLLGYLGSAYHKAGEHTKSLQYRERALEMIRGIHGKDAVQPTIVEARSKIAAVYEDLEEYTKAIKLYEDALDRVKSLHGANKTHPKILKLLDKLETVCNKAGDQEKASGYHEQTQALKAAVEGQENADNHNDIKQPLGE